MCVIKGSFPVCCHLHLEVFLKRTEVRFTCVSQVHRSSNNFRRCAPTLANRVYDFCSRPEGFASNASCPSGQKGHPTPVVQHRRRDAKPRWLVTKYVFCTVWKVNVLGHMYAGMSMRLDMERWSQYSWTGICWSVGEAQKGQDNGYIAVPNPSPWFQIIRIRHIPNTCCASPVRGADMKQSSQKTSQSSDFAAPFLRCQIIIYIYIYVIINAYVYTYIITWQSDPSFHTAPKMDTCFWYGNRCRQFLSYHGTERREPIYW